MDGVCCLLYFFVFFCFLLDFCCFFDFCLLLFVSVRNKTLSIETKKKFSQRHTNGVKQTNELNKQRKRNSVIQTA